MNTRRRLETIEYDQSDQLNAANALPNLKQAFHKIKDRRCLRREKFEQKKLRPNL